MKLAGAIYYAVLPRTDNNAYSRRDSLDCIPKSFAAAKLSWEVTVLGGSCSIYLLSTYLYLHHMQPKYQANHGGSREITVCIIIYRLQLTVLW